MSDVMDNRTQHRFSMRNACCVVMRFEFYIETKGHLKVQGLHKTCIYSPWPSPQNVKLKMVDTILSQTFDKISPFAIRGHT